jgi:hypothetical protein
LPCDEQEQTGIVQCDPSLDPELQRVQMPRITPRGNQ